jgi:predicted nucleotidyltransferase
MSNEHLTYAVELAKKAYHTSLFDYIILHGSVAQGTANPWDVEHRRWCETIGGCIDRYNSDVDLELIVRKGKSKSAELALAKEKLYAEISKNNIPVDFDFVTVERLEEFLRDPFDFFFCENHGGYFTRVLKKGLIFDGQAFSRKASEDMFLLKCYERLNALHEEFHMELRPYTTITGLVKS